MHIYNLDKWKHNHHFVPENTHGERNTHRVIWLTVITMAVEIIAGTLFGSMALLADGWHMATHVFALGITAFAYRYARKHADNRQYTFGTGKVGVLGGFTSAIVLAGAALLMTVESFQRLLAPEPIRFTEAMAVAGLGLIVNLVSAFLLQGHHSHTDDTGHCHHHDHNLKAAYFHVLADAMTSLLAIIALAAGKKLGWIWLDPLMGIVGALVIIRWAWGLLQDTSKILLDRNESHETIADIYSAIETDSDSRIIDLHIWQIDSNRLAAIVSLVTHYPKPPEYYKNLLKNIEQIVHVSVEVNTCHSEPCVK